ncbi:MAG TPA: DNA starvation/stationary phase protection protein [Phycisphaerales bacterium]|nr:DNA starvation/stationary phase protection protein [Phycisphaerales bacterium]
MAAKRSSRQKRGMGSRPIQGFTEAGAAAIALAKSARHKSIENLNQLLADTIVLRDLYKKHHWQVSGPTFYQLHLLFDKHAGEQGEIADAVAERVQTLGGVTVAATQDIADETLIPRPPRDREAPEVQMARLLQAHEIVLEEARAFARAAAAAGDDGTNDLIVSEVIRANELQAWFVGEHLRHGAEFSPAPISKNGRL